MAIRSLRRTVVRTLSPLQSSSTCQIQKYLHNPANNSPLSADEHQGFEFVRLRNTLDFDMSKDTSGGSTDPKSKIFGANPLQMDEDAVSRLIGGIVEKGFSELPRTIPATQNSSLFSLSSYSAEPSTSASYSRPNFSFNRISGRRLSSLSEEGSHGPAAINYCSLMQEDEYHKLANSTISELLEKLEEYGDSVDIDGYDVDYGNEVLTLKLGDLGTYVINKQSPNRQIWMSSPVSGPSRFDWDQNAEAWIYRRTKQNLIKVLETELEKLCEKPINLS
ncbi:hypothetical protein C2S51_036960 [Perilla frutescens var. frutescens]|nr:hypothetical protein C2S51_036960 [Perilla frutescens var. frutescens]